MAEGCPPKDPESQAKRPLSTFDLKLGEIQAGEAEQLGVQLIELN
jgi:hypothetical protein